MNNTLLKFLLFLLVCIPMASTDIFVPALPDMVKELNTNSATMSLILSCYMIGFSISMLTSGTLSDIYGRRKILIYTLSLYTIVCLLIALSKNIYFIIGLRFLQGVGGGSGFVVGRLILKDYFTEHDQFNMMSALSTSLAITPAIAPQVGVLCIKYTNWQSCFLISFLFGVFILYILLCKFKETNNSLTNTNLIKQLPLSFINTFKNKTFLGYSLIVSFAWCAYFNFIGLSSFLFQNKYGYSVANYAFVLGFVTMGYLIGTTATKWLYRRRYTLNNIIRIGVYMCCANVIVLTIGYIINIPFVVILGMMLIRIGIGLIMPTAQLGAMRTYDKNTGWHMGCLYFTEFTLGGSTVYLASIVDKTHVGAGMVGIIFISVILLFCGLSLIKPLPANNFNDESKLGL